MSVYIIHGFSKLSKEEKLSLLLTNRFISEKDLNVFSDFEVKNALYQDSINSIAENPIANYPLPLSIIPNVVINNEMYFVPVVAEESSVVAAASFAAKFWALHGGFKTRVLGENKIGQIHFTWAGNYHELLVILPGLKTCLLESVSAIAENMEKRGGGITGFELIDFTDQLEEYFQLRVSFNTVDSMGANFINTCLEQMAAALKNFLALKFEGVKSDCEIIMAILSNYTPECTAECLVECPREDLESISRNLGFDHFIKKFETAIQIASIDPYRAVTHNKGIYNGVDALVLATGNDFRAVEACGHAYASRNGKYTSLSWCENDDDMFRFFIRIPLSLGTIGGLTSLHPMAKLSLKILKNPNANQLMQIAVATGMANHFAAIRALVTNGIQVGHMKMHLSKILRQLDASQEETALANSYFSEHAISHYAVSTFLTSHRIQ